MVEVGWVRLYALRGLYLLIAVGLAVTMWPNILVPPDLATGSVSIVRVLLGTLGLLAVLGIRYPLRMLPLLFFEFLWKLIWLVAVGLRVFLHAGLDAGGRGTALACVGAIILVPLVIPWRYVIENYLRAPGEPWRRI